MPALIPHADSGSAPGRHRRIVSSVRLVVIGGALSYRALFNWTTPPMFIGTLLVGPLLQLLFFVYLGRQLGVADDRFYLLGNAVISSSTACVYGGTMAVANERRYGTLGAVLLSPRHRAPLWFGRALPYVLNGLVISVFTLSASCSACVFRLGRFPDSVRCCSPPLPDAPLSAWRWGPWGCASGTSSSYRTWPLPYSCS
ncbi:hypothetical protein OG338_13165 [Streptomyces sp. NBC_00726]|uniref:hypothetical protein n=1 Tax=Streptomyces sp. NBC_00726 TaxID=2903674 RepID=UPI00386BAD23